MEAKARFLVATVDRATDFVVAILEISGLTRAFGAIVGKCARVAIVAGDRLILVAAARVDVAIVQRTRVLVVAVDRCSQAFSILAAIFVGAGAVVVARRIAVDMRALARRSVASIVGAENLVVAQAVIGQPIAVIVQTVANLHCRRRRRTRTQTRFPALPRARTRAFDRLCRATCRGLELGCARVAGALHDAVIARRFHALLAVFPFHTAGLAASVARWTIGNVAAWHAAK